jgi:hypothetical protein
MILLSGCAARTSQNEFIGAPNVWYCYKPSNNRADVCARTMSLCQWIEGHIDREEELAVSCRPLIRD